MQKYEPNIIYYRKLYILILRNEMRPQNFRAITVLYRRYESDMSKCFFKNGSRLWLNSNSIILTDVAVGLGRCQIRDLYNCINL